MSVKSHLENAVKALEAERENQVRVIRERVTREIIVPYNQEMDIARDKAVAELKSELDATILAHQEEFAKKKKEIFDANEAKKESNATSVIATEAYTVTVKYDKAITKLKEQISEIKE